MEVAGVKIGRRRVLPPRVSQSMGRHVSERVRHGLGSMHFLLASGIGLLMSLACGMLVAHGAWKLPAALFALVVLVTVTHWGKMSAIAILVAAALYQAPITNIGQFPRITLAEFIAPIVLIVLCLQSTRRERTRRRWGVLERAIVAFTIVLAANLLRSKYVLTTIPSGVNRAYYDYFVALSIFAATYWLVLWRRIDTTRMIRLLYVIAAVGALVGVIVVAAHLPVNLGNLRYSVYDYSTGAVRVGFLEIFGAVGLAVAVTHPVRYRVVSIGLFAGALILSGGRATAVGAVLAVALYIAIVAQKSFRVIAIASLVACVMALAAVWAGPTVSQQPQMRRLAGINSQTFTADGRQIIYERSLSEFERHPLIGTGLGVPSSAIAPDLQASSDPNVTEFYRAQLEVGGHATYAALFKNFGLAGAIPFLAALAAAIIGAVRTRDRVGGFFFFALVTQAVAMVAGGNGSDPFFFFLLAACAAWLAARREVSATGGDPIGARPVAGQ